MDVASGTDRYLDITFGLQIVEIFSLVSVLFNYLQSEIKVMPRCLSVPNATSLHHCRKNKY